MVCRESFSPTPEDYLDPRPWGFVRLPDWGSDDEPLQLVYLDQRAVHDRVFLERSDFDDPALVQFVPEGAKPEAVTSASPSSSALLSHTTSSSSSAPITPSLGSSVQSVPRSPSSAPESPDSPRLNTSGLCSASNKSD